MEDVWPRLATTIILRLLQLNAQKDAQPVYLQRSAAIASRAFTYSAMVFVMIVVRKGTTATCLVNRVSVALMTVLLAGSKGFVQAAVKMEISDN